LLLIFFVTGPLLTLGILTGIVLRKIPSNARNFEYNAAVQTGLTWKIESVEYRSPYCVRLKKVRILDEITSKAVFFAPEIDLQYIVSENLGKFFPGIEAAVESTAESAADPLAAVTKWIRPDGFRRISAPNSVLTFEHYSDDGSASAVRNILFKLFARFQFLSEMPVQIDFENVGVFSGYSQKQPNKKPDRLRFVRGNLYRTKTEIRSDWKVQAPEFSELETQSLSIVQPHHSNGYEIALRTGKLPIPCEFAAVFCSAFRHFGSGCRFSGEFAVECGDCSEKIQTVRLKNVFFKDMDIVPFAKEYTPFTVSGTVHDLQIHRAVFGQKDFTAEGCLQIVDGSMETTLFHRFVDRFHLTVEPSDILESPRQAVPFTACAVHFRLQPDGAVFCPDERWKDALMYQKADDSGLGQMAVYFPKDNRQPVSYHTIFSIFAPDTAPVVPLTSGLKKLFSILPADELSKPNGIFEHQMSAAAPVSVRAEIKPAIANPVTVKPTSAVLFVDPKK
jgi:hypothetical protein